MRNCDTCKSVKMALKREFHVSDTEEHSNTTVHGIILEVLPINVSRKNPDVKYFSRKITMFSSHHRNAMFYLSVSPA